MAGCASPSDEAHMRVEGMEAEKEKVKEEEKERKGKHMRRRLAQKEKKRGSAFAAEEAGQYVQSGSVDPLIYFEPHSAFTAEARQYVQMGSADPMQGLTHSAFTAKATDSMCK